MNRFFYRPDQLQNNLVTLTGEEARHLSCVLRAVPGNRVELCAVSGQCHVAVIVSLDQSRVVCRLAGEQLPGNEALLEITLAFGMPKGQKTDQIVQQATELGVATLVPFYSERSVPRPDLCKEEDKTGRLQRIARSSAAQSRRSRIPVVLPPSRWPDLLASFAGFQRVLLFFEGEKRRTLRAALTGAQAGNGVLLVTGPEGGFTAKETEEALAAGAAAVTLGPRILRAETAAVTAVALAFYEAGEMGAY